MPAVALRERARVTKERVAHEDTVRVERSDEERELDAVGLGVTDTVTRSDVAAGLPDALTDGDAEGDKLAEALGEALGEYEINAVALSLERRMRMKGVVL